MREFSAAFVAAAASVDLVEKTNVVRAHVSIETTFMVYIIFL